jgi:hypothetical protein
MNEKTKIVFASGAELCIEGILDVKTGECFFINEETASREVVVNHRSWAVTLARGRATRTITLFVS